MIEVDKWFFLFLVFSAASGWLAWMLFIIEYRRKRPKPSKLPKPPSRIVMP